MVKKDYTEEAAEEQWQKAVAQINGYAAAPRVEALFFVVQPLGRGLATTTNTFVSSHSFVC